MGYELGFAARLVWRAFVWGFKTAFYAVLFLFNRKAAIQRQKVDVIPQQPEKG